MTINKGDILQCDLLRNGERFGQRIPVEVREVTRDFHTGEPVSVRVRAVVNGKERFVWVQPRYLRESI